jgi:arylsulfatase A-like enzyme/Flp pilus assembly protein TadD
VSAKKARLSHHAKATATKSGRRSLLRWGVAVAALVLVTVVALWWPRERAFVLEPGADQNVLLVTIDTLRADALGSYGGRAQTPNLDRLAAGGARFTFAHAHAVVTLPSHTTILTGRLPYEHGMRDNSGFRVKDGTATLATRLKAAGFATGAFVGGFPLTKRFGLTPGFDVYDDQIPELEGDISFTMPERRADEVVSRAVDWIGKTTNRFFTWVHVFDPHSPYKPPAELAAMYAGQPYYGEVAFVDRALGPLFDRLATLSRPTLVVITADHGESLGEHGEMTHGMFAYEATLRVPLIIARIEPGSTRPSRGIVIDTPARHVDIAPTVLEAVGVSADGPFAGTSLKDVIRAGRGDDRPAYFESMTFNLVRGWAPLRGVLVEKRKYIDQPVPELYDLAADPTEERNDASKERDRLQVMVNLLRTYDVAPPNRPGQESAEVAATLRSLGYVSGSAPERKVFTEADDLKNLVHVDRDLHTASELYQDGKVQDAIALLTRVIASRPDTADAYISLAHAYWEGGQLQPAIATLERALTNGAPARDVRIRLGIYLAESQTDSQRAITLLEGLPVSDVEALNGLGVAYGGAGRYADAIQAFNRVLTLDPTNGLAYQNLASMVLRQALVSKNGTERRSKLQEAERYARQALDADPSLPKAYTTLGVVLAESGRKNEAIDSWKRAVALDGREFDALYNLTVLLLESRQVDEARVYAKQFVATAPPALYESSIDQLRKFLGS